MAITFSKTISELKILNAYNNNVVEFASDNVLDATKCNINIGGLDFEITPISNVFRFNYKEVISSLINTNNFEDTSFPNATLEIDNSLNGSWLVTYTITFSDLSTEQTTQTYVFLKSVEQIGNVSNRLLANQNLFSDKNITIFNGYPFDIGRYSNGNLILSTSKKTQTITSTATNTERLFFLDYQTGFKTRVVADGGETINNPCAVYEVGNDFLSEGYNTVNIGSEVFTINVKDVNCGGTYLKWFNIDKGAWGYWLFNPIYKEKTTVKTLDTFNVDFESIDNTYTTELVTARSPTKTRELNALSLSEDEMLQIKSILVSPRVEMYNGSYGDAVTTASWQTVKIKSASQILVNNKNPLIDFNLTIEINQYTNA